jgi:3-oxoacyl-[acyl-carrier-protein] synthase III
MSAVLWEPGLRVPSRVGATRKLAAAAVHEALRDAGRSAAHLSYLIAHTASPRELVPPNVVHIASLLNYHGPVIELRQA